MAEIKAKAPKVSPDCEASFNFDFPATALEAIDMFGDEIVNQSFISKQTIGAQAAIRSMLEAGKSPEEVKVYMEKNWKPGASMSDPTTNAVNAFKNMSAEEQKAFLEMLQKAAGA
jgi:hypothetical protein